MRDYIRHACEELDAAMFTGDAFIGEHGDAVCHRKGLRSYLGRWERQLVRNEKSEEPVEAFSGAEMIDLSDHNPDRIGQARLLLKRWLSWVEESRLPSVPLVKLSEQFLAQTLERVDDSVRSGMTQRPVTITKEMLDQSKEVAQLTANEVESLKEELEEKSNLLSEAQQRINELLRNLDTMREKHSKNMDAVREEHSRYIDSLLAGQDALKGDLKKAHAETEDKTVLLQQAVRLLQECYKCIEEWPMLSTEVKLFLESLES